MLCPKCQFDHPSQTTECLKCGVVFSRYEQPLACPDAGRAPVGAASLVAAATMNQIPAAALPAMLEAALAATVESATPQTTPKTELMYRLFALPAALLVAYLAAGSGLPGVAAGMLAMVVHESGHAIASWLTGRWAIPMLWVTMHGETRSWAVILSVTAAILCAGFLAWKMNRWGWVCAAGAVLLLQIVALNSRVPAEALIVFFGDGGALVLATILMAAFYAPHESKLYRSWGMRWGLLVIGALAFMHVFRLWSGPYENIPFGELEGVNLSDPSLLTEMWGWSVIQLVDRYLVLAKICFAALAAVYIWGLISAYADIWTSSHPKPVKKTATS